MEYKKLSGSSREDALKMLRRDMGDITVGTYIPWSKKLLTSMFDSNAEAASFVESHGCRIVFNDPRCNENLAAIRRPLPTE